MDNFLTKSNDRVPCDLTDAFKMKEYQTNLILEINENVSFEKCDRGTKNNKLIKEIQFIERWIKERSFLNISQK